MEESQAAHHCRRVEKLKKLELRIWGSLYSKDQVLFSVAIQKRLECNANEKACGPCSVQMSLHHVGRRRGGC